MGFFNGQFSGMRTIVTFVIISTLLSILYYPAQASRYQAPPLPRQGEAVDLSVASSTDSFPSSLEPLYSGCGGASVNAFNSQYEQQVVELVNAERAAAGKPPLKKIDPLDQVARYHAADMFQDTYFEHDTYDRISGQLQKVCTWSTRLSSSYSNWSNLGENIAFGYPTPEDVMAGWMNSTGHRANILRDTFYEIGIGYYDGFWVQDFGRRTNIFPVIINGEAASTDSRDVTLYIYGTWTDMRIRNNIDPWSAWRPFHNNVTWQLPNLAGNQMVSVELRNTGTTVASSDSIYLNLPGQVELGALPQTITFTYSLSSQAYLQAAVPLALYDIDPNSQLTWQATSDQTWLKLNPASGTTPGTLMVSTDNFTPKTVGSYSGSILLTVTAANGVVTTLPPISITMNVMEPPFWKNYLPLSIK